MANESKTMAAARLKKERCLAGLRELQLRQAEGKLLSATQVEEAWSGAIIRLRDAMLSVPVKCAPRFADPKHAEAIIRSEVEVALKQLGRRA